LWERFPGALIAQKLFRGLQKLLSEDRRTRKDHPEGDGFYRGHGNYTTSRDKKAWKDFGTGSGSLAYALFAGP